MASSEVQICNLALARVGVSIFIAALDERSTTANVCNLFYEPCRDFVMADDVDWNFATKRIFLADLGTPPNNWAYRYALPTDCLKARFIVVDGMRKPRVEERIPFEVAAEEDIRVLYTDQPIAELVYTKRVTNPNLFSEAFKMTLAWHLAAEIALPLSAAPNLGNRAVQAYNAGIMIARAASLNEAEEGPEPESEFIAGRN